MNRDQFRGLRVAVAGMGVSGRAVGAAVQKLGGIVEVLDEKPGDIPSILAAMDELQAQGITAHPGWHGRLDPNDYDLLILSPGFPMEHPAIHDMAGKKVMGEVEFAYQIAEAPILAITGTNGKSTTTVLLWHLLTGAHQDAWLCGNISGSGYPEQTLTEAALAAGPDSFLVAEISSYQLEFVQDFRPKVSAITNITPDHMDRYRSFDEYRNAKLNLFTTLGEGQKIVVNCDDTSIPESALTKAENRGAQIIRFSPSGRSTSTGQTRRHPDHLALSGENLPLNELPLWGEHNIANAMMAWEMAAAAIRPSIGMLEALKTFRGLAHRMERIGERHGVVVINNSMCTNPAALVASSQGLPRRQHILVGGNTKRLDFAPAREYFAGAGHQLYLFGNDTNDLADMLGGAWPRFPSLEGAFSAATGAAQAGEAILLSPGCASAEPFVHFRERGEAFKEIAQRWLDL